MLQSPSGRSANEAEPWDIDCFTSGGEGGGTCGVYPELAHLFTKFEKRIETAGGIQRVMDNVIGGAPGKLYRDVKQSLTEYARKEGTQKVLEKVRKNHPKAEAWWEPPSEGATFGTTWVKYND